MLLTSPVVRPLVAVLFMSVAGLLSSPAQAGLRYQYKDAKDLIYEVDEQTEFNNQIRRRTGYMLVRVESVDATNGQVTFKVFSVGQEAKVDKPAPGKELPLVTGPVPTPPPHAKGPEILIDSFGKILRVSNVTPGQTPSIFFSHFDELIPLFPQTNEDTWKQTGEDTYIDSDDNNQHVATTSRIFKLGSREGDIQKFTGKMEGMTAEKVGNDPRLKLTKTVNYEFDAKLGYMRSYDATVMLELNETNLKLRLPVTLKIRLLSQETVDRLKTISSQPIATALPQPKQPGNPFQQTSPPPPPPQQPQQQVQITTTTPPPAPPGQTRWMNNTMFDPAANARNLRSVKELRQGPALNRTQIVGNQQGSDYQVIDNGSNRPVRGFRVENSQWGPNPIFRSLTPLFDDPGTQSPTVTFAREGYAVAGLHANTAEFLAGIKVIYAKVVGKKLDLTQTYESEWLGGNANGGQTIRIGNTGQLVIGIHGKRGMNIHSVGLVLEGEPPAPDPANIEQFNKFAKHWQPVANGANVSDLLSQMLSNGSRSPEGAVQLDHGQIVTSTQTFNSPVSFRTILNSGGGDTRLSFAADQVIFNWEMRQDEIRVDGGPANGRHLNGPGRLPVGQWCALEWVVKPNEMIFYVNGQERYRAQGDFSQLNRKFTLKAHTGSMQVKSIEVVQ